MKKSLNWMLALATSLTMISVYACDEQNESDNTDEYVYEGVVLEREADDKTEEVAVDDRDLDLEDQNEE